MPAKEKSRKLRELRRRFAAALELTEQTREQWAEKNGVTAPHLYMVLTGRRDSRSLVERVEKFADETLAAATPATLSA